MNKIQELTSFRAGKVNGIVKVMACLEITLQQMQNCFCLAKFMNQGIYHPKNLSIQSNFYKKAYLSLYLFVFFFQI